MFFLQHSEYVPELLLESEEKYRFYSELKRSVNSVEINQNDANIRFEYGDVKYVFSEGKILAIKDEKIADKALDTEFSKKPTEVFRRLQKYITSLSPRENI